MSDAGQKTILLVDDEIVISLSEAQDLKARGYRVIQAESGEKAVDIVCVKKESVDLVLMDVDLGGGMDGPETAKEILKKHDIPVVFLSSHIETEIVQKTEKITSYGYVVKNSGIVVLDASIKMAFKLFDEIAERKRAEEALREKEKFLSTIIENIPDMIFIKEAETLKFIRINKAVESILGYKSEEFAGKTDYDFFPKEQADFFTKNDRDALRSGQLCDTEEEPISTKEGERFLHTKKIPLYDENGTPVYLLGISEDITERKRTEKAFKESEQRLSNIIDFLPDATFAIDLEGKVIAWNRAIEEMTGVRAENILGKGNYEYALPFYGIRRPILIDLVFVSSEEISKKYLFVTKDGDVILAEADVPIKGGEIRNLWGKAVPLYDITGNIVGAIEAIRDITDRKRAEDEIKKLLKEKDLILKEVHHRIKNNMNTVYALLAIQANSLDNSILKNILLDAAGRIQSMRVLYDKLYFSETNCAVSIRDYFPALIDEIISIFPQKEWVSIETQIDDILLNAKTLSPLGIIINELITNAMKYAFPNRNNGIITISASKIDSHIFVTFTDNGIGMPEAISFESSTGFGLQLIEMLIKQLKGSVVIERQQGTKFIIEFDV